MKRLLSLTAALVLFTAWSAASQHNSLVKYYDENWTPVSIDSAFYYAEFEPETDGYKCTSWWMKSKKLNCISHQSDTLFTKTTGALRRYYETGQLQDSSYFQPETGILQSTFYYYNTGRLWVTYNYDPKTKIEKTVGYDEKGKKIENFVYQKEAQFREGNASWMEYLSGNIKSKTPVKKGAPKGSYRVIIKFIVGTDGSVIDAVAETNLGYGMEEEGLRVIKKSPKWSPAILLNKQVNAYRRQPLTFIVEEK